ncbi:nicotinate-nucleotide diphosphorylase (carboxylating) Ecym_2592 [Eremothecium cymbalariae DBVPG|uniref:Nicotinate-nucleotide pyrophosphorylase [carboxylating] n=1 Tax=Eremothecium cymbalariae (strain CBS 270.75 / DBVPG 7215 / KCTC 17166 / NRRL Y-17582) TaxID=931890 RepID=G8JQH4_ERECY|nr:Hypothetical protein Ecym_2592 [Eremothecium cymbalariae DBVPG\
MPEFKNLIPANGAWKQDITNWLQEDIPAFDFGGYVVGSNEKNATLYCKQPGILAGVPFLEEVFNQCGLSYTWLYEEGEYLDPSESSEGKLPVADVRGEAKNLLMAERTALNILSRCSGIATASHNIITLARKAGYQGIIAGTRKTTPGLRRLEKYSMLVGGCDMHRYDLSSMVMLKDNHIWATGSITNAVQDARQVCGFSVKIEVECQSEAEADEAIQAGADIIMLDNFSGVSIRSTARSLKQKWADKKQFLLECSGGLKIDNLPEYLCNDIDIYSTSSIHQGTGVLDFSLKLNH